MPDQGTAQHLLVMLLICAPLGRTDARLCRGYAGRMPTTPTTPPATPRSAALWLDLVAGILLMVIAALIGFVMLAVVTQLANLSSECTGIAVSGTHCSPGFLSAMVILGTGIVVFAWFLAAGFLIMRAIRRRLVFFLPFIAFAVVIAGFYLVTALVGTLYIPAA